MPVVSGGYGPAETFSPKASLLIAYLIHLTLILWLCRFLYQNSIRLPLRTLFWWALSAKLIASIGMGLLYKYYYPYQGDTFAYFNDAARLASFAWQQPVAYLKIVFLPDSGAEPFAATLPLWEQPRAFFMVKLVSILCLITFNNYWLCGLYLSLLCFYELWKLANLLAGIFPGLRSAAGIAFLLLPSVVFWSAGLTKESLAMACIAGVVRLFLTWRFADTERTPACVAVSFSAAAWLWLPVYLLLLWKLKYYYLAALLPVLLAFLITDVFAERGLIKSRAGLLLLLVATFAIILISATFLHPNLHIANFLDALVTNHAITVQASSPENIIHFTGLQPTAGSVAGHLPEAAFSGLYRPLIWEGSSLFQWYTGLENLLLLGLSAYVLVVKRKVLCHMSHTYALLITATLVYTVLLGALLALSSPNFGALSRYKVAFLPFFAFLLLGAIWPERKDRRPLEKNAWHQF